MSLYKRNKIWWYKFQFAGKVIQESAKTTSKLIAHRAEKVRRRELELGFNGIADDRTGRVQSLREVAEKYSADYQIRNPKSFPGYAKYCIQHLVEHLGDKMLTDISRATIENYQTARLKEGASGKTINEEVSTLLRMMEDRGDQVRLEMKRKKTLKLKERKNVGRALTPDEEARILSAAKKSKSHRIYPGIVLSLNTTMRDTEMKCLAWNQVDLDKLQITVGESKTEAGAGRTIPINTELARVLNEYRRWYVKNVGPVKPEHYVFPWRSKERKYYPTRPMTTFKTAWLNVRRKAKVNGIRFHDLRHTAVTKLAENGAGDETIMSIAGHVSRSMLSRYAHIRTEAKRRALEAVKTG